MESGSSPLSCGVFVPLPFSQAFRSWLLGTCPHSCWSLSGQTWLVYLVPGGIPLPTFGTQGAPPSLLCVFIVLIAYYSVSLLSPGWWSVCPGGYTDLVQGCLWEYCILLSSPCPCFPKPSGHRHLVAQGPSWFLRLMWCGDALRRLEVWRGQSFASSRWPCLQVVSPVSL
jgi:hypothetical protein